jgi:hypothetical protein
MLGRVDPMAVRGLAVSLATDPLSVFLSLWDRRTLVNNEERLLRWRALLMRCCEA